MYSKTVQLRTFWGANHPRGDPTQELT